MATEEMKPILFNTEMVKAILEGRKTVTRRVVKFKDGKNPNWTGYIKDGITLYNGTNEPCNIQAPYQINDVLYVRETWSEWTGGYIYKAWSGPFPQPGASTIMNWHPSIHMPKEAARIFLRVTDVRVERLQDMSTKEDFKKEGILDDDTYPTDRSVKVHPMAQGGWTLAAYKERFEMIWNSTIKKDQLDIYGWDANPFVWVIEFEKIEI